jgi:hypothetical protein
MTLTEVEINCKYISFYFILFFQTVYFILVQNTTVWFKSVELVAALPKHPSNK